MSNLDQHLPYIYEKDDDKNPESIRLETNGSFNKINEKVENNPGHFKRVSEYSNGLIVSEEMHNGKHIFRFNKPFTEAAKGILRF